MARGDYGDRDMNAKKYYDRIKGFVFPQSASHHFRSGEYWESRYNHGGNSGHGSYGQLAEFKAEVINGLVTEFGVSRVVELGCGDGNNASLYRIESYVGLDVSRRAILTCRERFAADSTKRFALLGEFAERADMAMSLDVIFHLIEDSVYDDYMERLFACASNYVLIYSSCANCRPPATHVRHRNFFEWISRKRPDARIVRVVANRYPARDILEDTPDTSFSDFYLFDVS